MNIMYDEKLLGTVAFSNGCLCSKELVQREHRHFHPSGVIIPSKEDISVHKRLKEAGELMGIPIVDHVIIGSEGYLSFKEQEIL